MDYETGKKFEVIEANEEFIYRVCKEFDKFIIDSDGASVFDKVREQLEEEAKGEGEDKEVEPKSKKKGK